MSESGIPTGIGSRSYRLNPARYFAVRETPPVPVPAAPPITLGDERDERRERLVRALIDRPSGATSEV